MSKTILNKKNTSFLGDVLRLISGSGLSQIISIASIPIITRLFAPEAFGEVAIALTFASVLAVVTSLSYQYAIVSPESDSDAANVLVLSLCFSTFFSALVFLPLLIISSNEIFSLFGINNKEEVFAYLIALHIWTLSTFSCLTYWNTRTKHFTRLSIARIVGTSFGVICSIYLGVSGHVSGYILLSAQILGQVLGMVTLAALIIRDDVKFLHQATSFGGVVSMMKRFSDFPKFYTCSNLVNVLTSHLPVIFLGAFFTPAVVGFYSLAERVLQAPTSLVSSAISQVFHQQAASAYNNGKVAELTRQTFTKLVMIGVFPILLAGLFAQEIFVTFFGDEWSDAGVFAAILSPLIAVRFFSSPLSILSAVMNKQSSALIFSLTWLITSLLALTTGFVNNSYYTSIIIYSSVSVILFFLRTLIYHHWVNLPVMFTVKSVSSPLFWTLCVFVILVLMKKLEISQSLLTIVFLLISVIWLFFLMKKQFRK
jgi:lipopolysaccharide exporter